MTPVNDIWTRLGFALTYPWFKLLEIRTSHHYYNGSGEWVDTDTDTEDYRRGETASLLGFIPTLGYLTILTAIYTLDFPAWVVIPVALLAVPCMSVVLGGVTVTGVEE
jgi:hypothetical protein